jgi:hypothetical protein
VCTLFFWHASFSQVDHVWVQWTWQKVKATDRTGQSTVIAAGKDPVPCRPLPAITINTNPVVCSRRKQQTCMARFISFFYYYLVFEPVSCTGRIKSFGKKKHLITAGSLPKSVWTLLARSLACVDKSVAGMGPTNTPVWMNGDLDWEFSFHWVPIPSQLPLVNICSLFNALLSIFNYKLFFLKKFSSFLLTSNVLTKYDSTHAYMMTVEKMWKNLICHSRIIYVYIDQQFNFGNVTLKFLNFFEFLFQTFRWMD